jgi:hypothetical protein
MLIRIRQTVALQSRLVVFVACWVVCLGFHSSVLILLMSRSMFLTPPFQPLPPSSLPVSLSLTFLRFVSFTIISVMVLTVVWSSEPMLQILTWFRVFSKRRARVIDHEKRIVDSIIGEYIKIVSSDNNLSRGIKLLLGDILSQVFNSMKNEMLNNFVYAYLAIICSFLKSQF